MPEGRLTVVTLRDRDSYAAFAGEAPGDAVGGHFDREANQLVIFDFRPDQKLPAGVNAARVNSFALVHEAAHQLSFNTGLLALQGDVPDAISEGLAMFAELWRNDGRSVIGAINRLRLQVLVDQARQGNNETWYPLSRLLTDDALFQEEASQQFAYAEASVLVHHHLKSTPAIPRFRAYLNKIRPRLEPSQRLADARSTLGDLTQLDRTVRNHARRLIQG